MIRSHYIVSIVLPVEDMVSSISTMLEQVQTLKEFRQAIHDPETKEGSLEAREPGVSSLRLGCTITILSI